MEEAVSPVVWVEKDAFVLAGDVLVLLERAVAESLPPYKDDKGPQNRTKVCDESFLLFPFRSFPRIDFFNGKDRVSRSHSEIEEGKNYTVRLR